MTPVERIDAEYRAFRMWSAPEYMTAFEREYTFGDRRGTALARVIGRMLALLDTGTLSPESLADAVAVALRVPDEDLVFGRKPGRELEPYEPAPFVKASPAEVAEAYASSAVYAAGQTAEPRPTGWLLADEMHHTAVTAGGLG